MYKSQEKIRSSPFTLSWCFDTTGKKSKSCLPGAVYRISTFYVFWVSRQAKIVFGNRTDGVLTLNWCTALHLLDCITKLPTCGASNYSEDNHAIFLGAWCNHRVCSITSTLDTVSIWIHADLIEVTEIYLVVVIPGRDKLGWSDNWMMLLRRRGATWRR